MLLGTRIFSLWMKFYLEMFSKERSGHKFWNVKLSFLETYTTDYKNPSDSTNTRLPTKATYKSRPIYIDNKHSQNFFHPELHLCPKVQLNNVSVNKCLQKLHLV